MAFARLVFELERAKQAAEPGMNAFQSLRPTCSGDNGFWSTLMRRVEYLVHIKLIRDRNHHDDRHNQNDETLELAFVLHEQWVSRHDNRLTLNPFTLNMRRRKEIRSLFPRTFAAVRVSTGQSFQRAVPEVNPAAPSQSR